MTFMFYCAVYSEERLIQNQHLQHLRAAKDKIKYYINNFTVKVWDKKLCYRCDKKKESKTVSVVLYRCCWLSVFVFF